MVLGVDALDLAAQPLPEGFEPGDGGLVAAALQRGATPRLSSARRMGAGAGVNWQRTPKAE